MSGSTWAASKEVDWVAVHLLDVETPGIRFPTSLTLTCADTGASWGTWPRPSTVTRQDSEYVFSNPTPLNRTCRLLTVHLANDSWTFLSELELTTD